MIGENATVEHTSKEVFKYKLHKFVRIEFGGDHRIPLYVMHVSKPDCEDWKSVNVGKFTKYNGVITTHSYYPRLEDFIQARVMINNCDDYVFLEDDITSILEALSQCISTQIVKTEIIETEGIVYL